jgi:hypothetical protein
MCLVGLKGSWYKAGRSNCTHCFGTPERQAVAAKLFEEVYAKKPEHIADNLSKAGWSWGCVATVDRDGRTIFVADAHRDDGKRFVARSDEKLTAFLELERVTRDHCAS